jgi:chromosome segregation ATPase
MGGSMSNELKNWIDYFNTHDYCEGDVKSLVEACEAQLIHSESQAREIEELKASKARLAAQLEANNPLIDEAATTLDELRAEIEALKNAA